MLASPWPFWVLGAVLVGAGGLLMMLALFRDRARGRRRCPACWYDLTSLPGMTCPECGHEAASESDLARTRRHRAKASIAAAAIAAGVATGYAVPRVQRDGWVWLVPTPALQIAVGMSDKSQVAAAQAAVTAATTPGIASPASATPWDRAVAAHRAAQALREIAEDNDVRTVGRALPALVTIANTYPESRVAEGAVRDFLDARCVVNGGGVRVVALRTMDRLDPDRALSRYVAISRFDKDPAWRAWAMPDIVRRSRPTERAVELIIGGLRDPEPIVRRATAVTLGSMGRSAMAARKELEHLAAGDTDPRTQALALAALKAIGREEPSRRPPGKPGN